MKKVIVLLAAVLFSMTMFAQEAAPAKSRYTVGKGKINVGANLGFQMQSSDFVDVTMFSFGQVGSLNQFHPATSGLNVTYGITDEMEVTLGLPVFAMTSMSMELMGVSVDSSVNTMFGKPYLAFLYGKHLGAMSVNVSPYLSLPFAEMYSGDADGDVNFKQPIGFGLNLVVASEGPSPILWEALISWYMGLENDDYAKEMDLTIGVYGGYKLNPKSCVKLGFLMMTPNLQAEGDDAPGFADGTYMIDVQYGMMINEKMGFKVSAMYYLPMKAMEEVTAFGISAGFNMSF